MRPPSTHLIAFVAATIVAGALVWFWALRPVGFASYLTPSGTGSEEIVQIYWPFRLVEPSWLGGTPNSLDQLMRWHYTEALLRLVAIVIPWLLLAAFFVRRSRLGVVPSSIRSAKGPVLLAACLQLIAWASSAQPAPPGGTGLPPMPPMEIGRAHV